MSRVNLILLLVLFLSGCAHFDRPDQVSLSLLTGWVDGNPVYYVTTDVSDSEMASQMGANYAPRLSSAIPAYPKPPQLKTVLERVYAFPKGEQKNNVFASAPAPLGYESEDINYSPVWLMYLVEWLVSDNVQELRSEGDIFKAESQGWVKITRTNVVVNCPVVSIDGQRFLSTL